MVSDKQIIDSIIKFKLIDWKTLQFLQDSNFKDTDILRLEKLKHAIKKHGFNMPFFVWENKKTLWCVDGFHRMKDLEILEDEGWSVPEKLPAVFIDCKNKKDAAEKLLGYSSIYATVSDEGLYAFIHQFELDFPSVQGVIDLPNFNLPYFMKGYISDDVNYGDSTPYMEETLYYDKFKNQDTGMECPKCGHKWIESANNDN